MRVAFALLLWLVSPQAAERAQRRSQLDPSTPVSDDPRRVPIPPAPRGPEGSLVLRDGYVVVEGGRVAVGRHEPRPQPRPRS